MRDEDRTGPGDVELRLFGPMGVVRGGEEQTIPASRKTRAILGFLALSPRPVTRQRLCDIFFDVPDDPRAALRWSLHKLRPLVDAAEGPALIAERESLKLGAPWLKVDAIRVLEIAARPAAELTPDECRTALDLMAGTLLEDADLPDRLEFSAWLASRRAEYQTIAMRLARRLADEATGDSRIVELRRLVSLGPGDETAALALVEGLMATRQADEARAFVDAFERAHRLDGLEPGPGLRAALRMRPRAAKPPASHAMAGQVEAVAQPPAADPAGTSVAAGGTPVVAVLPLQDLSLEPLPAHVPAGFADGLTHALSRFRSLTVISAESSARYRDQLVDPAAVADALCADVLVGGSLASGREGRLRVRWRAVDGPTGRILASGEADGELADLWDLQETVADRVAVEVEPRALAETLKARLTRPTHSPDAYDLYLQGLFAGFSQDGRDFAGALELFERALALDPGLHPALAMAPWAAAYSNAIQSPDDLARYAQMSREALARGRDDARTQATAGTALLYMGHAFEEARNAIDRALALNPNEYTAWICGGWMHAMRGEADAAHAMFDHAERLNPLAYGANGMLSGRAMADFMVGRIREAERSIRQALGGNDSHPSALMTGLATSAVLGLGPELQARRAAFLAIYPQGLDDVAIQALPFEIPACRTRYFDAVAAALRVV